MMVRMSEAIPARRGRTPSADVERELLAAAEAVLVREGPAGLTVRAVAAEAGIAPMGVYNRLGGKDGLVEALLIKGFDRLRVSLEEAFAAAGEPAMRGRFISCGLAYRRFALANPHFYAIMFEDAILHEHDSQEVHDHAAACFGALVRAVEMSAAAGVIAAPDPLEVAQQIWSAVHGAVALELKGLVLTPDPEYTYQAFIATLIRGLAPR
ncbi:TetR/AcrR family transcriptional regulator [Trebonia kvetii]|uniref:TetR/AcrR family transcriptional regulator n=2 Tax=Trebonia kvetii TaxID=2480626 RepID=A0A6P2BMK1_9ACTN|nr:TetR/AcrR family transcriptional regulator [Trebonia kvetii]